MFSKDNRRFSILAIVIGVLAVVTMVLISNMVAHGNSTSTSLLTGFVAIIIFQLMGMLRQEQANSSAEQHRNKITGKIEEATDKADVAAQKAEEAKNEAAQTKAVVVEIEKHTNGNLKEAFATPTPEQVAMPKNHDELREMVKLIADEFCDEAIEGKLKKAFAEQQAKGLQADRDKAEGI
jgi:hypothetical protein